MSEKELYLILVPAAWDVPGVIITATTDLEYAHTTARGNGAVIVALPITADYRFTESPGGESISDDNGSALSHP